MRLASLLFSLALLFAAPSACAQAHEIVVANDLHFIAPELTDGGPFFTQLIESADGKVMAYVDELTDAFFAEVIARQPACLILAGDLTFNGAKESHERLAEKLARVRDAGVPVLVLPGNHDLNSTSAARFEGESCTRIPGVTADEFEEIYHRFGFSEALARDAHSLSYIAEPVPGVRVVMLDVNTKGAPNAVPALTLLWLEQQLQRAQEADASVIAVSHQNLFAHSDLLYNGFVIKNAKELLALYLRYGVAVNLSGHLHIQHVMRSHAGLPEIATQALSVSPCAYGVITLADGEAVYEKRAVDVSAWARASGRTDENLLDFAAYAARFFEGGGRTKIAASLGDLPQAQAMADFFVDLNAAYFAGRMDAFPWNDEIAALWARQPESFMTRYIASMLREGAVDHTKLRFPL